MTVMYKSESRSFVSDSLRLLCPWDFPGNSTRVDCHFLLQGIFPSQGSNPCLSHCRQMLYHLSHNITNGEFNSNKHYIYCHGQKSIRRNGVTLIVNKSLKYSTWVQPQK